MRRLVPAIFLIAAVLFYRLIADSVAILPNFAPVAAICLCAGIFFPRGWAMAIPFAGLLLSDIVLNFRHAEAIDGALFFNVEFLLRYGIFALILGLGFLLRRHRRVLPILGGSLAASLLFYLIANTGSWLVYPGYAKSFAGWLQSQTTGLPGFAPSWMFLRNSLLGDLFFTGLFLVCHLSLLEKKPRPAKSAADDALPAGL